MHCKSGWYTERAMKETLKFSKSWPNTYVFFPVHPTQFQGVLFLRSEIQDVVTYTDGKPALRRPGAYVSTALYFSISSWCVLFLGNGNTTRRSSNTGWTLKKGASWAKTQLRLRSMSNKGRLASLSSLENLTPSQDASMLTAMASHLLSPRRIVLSTCTCCNFKSQLISFTHLICERTTKWPCWTRQWKPCWQRLPSWKRYSQSFLAAKKTASQRLGLKWIIYSRQIQVHPRHVTWGC